MTDSSLLPHRLSLDPDFFRAQALHALALQRAELVAAGEAHTEGYRALVEAVPPPDVRLAKGAIFMNTLGREVERCDRAIREIEGQRAC